MQSTETGNWQDHIDPLTRRVLVAAGFIQGVILYLLIEYLPETTFYSLQFVFYSLAIALFWMLICVTQDIRDSRLWLLLGGYGLVLALVALHTGGQCSDGAPGRCGGGVHPYIVTQLFCWCLLSFVFRALLEQRSGLPAYPLLFKYSWHNFFVVTLAAFYLGMFWSVLFLGAWLFKIVNIEVFWEARQEPWFIFPVSGAVIAYGATVVRKKLTIVTILYRVLHTVIGGLLPMLALISVCFLLVLPFTGLQPLWNTGISAWILLWLVAFLLFFTNASVQYGNDQHWTGLWRWLIRSALVVLPVYLLLAGYSLWLRIDQYGLTSDRVWGVIVCLILSGYSLCYALGIVLKRGRWTHHLGRINTSMSGVIIVALILANTPFLNVQKMVADNQVERLLNGTTSFDDFDLDYLMHDLGKPGTTALEKLVNDARFNSLAHADDLAEAIKQGAPEIRLQNLSIRNYITPLPEELHVPEKMYAVLHGELRSCMRHACYIMQLPLKENVVNFVLVKVDEARYAKGYLRSTVHQEIAGEWDVVGYIRVDDRGDIHNFRAALMNNDIQVIESEWKDIQVGDTRLRIE